MELLDPEIGDQVKRPRGPKPLSVRAQFALMAWLDGEILWREGRVVWRLGGKIVEIGSRELDAVSRALSSLGRHQKTARRVEPEFDAWQQKRLAQLQNARRLTAITAPDLAALTSPSRRRNPAALGRLAQLLTVEASVAEPLPTSPARALFEAWPLSENLLRGLLRDQNQPLEARALASLALGARAPFEAWPSEPWLRRAARFGAQWGFPRTPQLVVALLQSDARGGQECAARLEACLGCRAPFAAPFALDETQLLALHRAGKDAATIAGLAETALDLPDPFPSLSFAPVAPKRFDFAAQRATSESWNALRLDSHAAFRGSLSQIAARGGAADLERASHLLQRWISAPLRALGALKVQTPRGPQPSGALSGFQKSAQEAVSIAIHLLEAVADAPDPGGALELLKAAMDKGAACPKALEKALEQGLSPKDWAAAWHSHAREIRETAEPLLGLAREFGADAARQALDLDCWRELARQRRFSPELLLLALELAAWAPRSANDFMRRFARWGHHWNGLAGAETAFAPLRDALDDAEPEERALWLNEIWYEIEASQRGVRGDLPALFRLIPIMRRAKSDGETPRWALVEVARALQKAAPDVGPNTDCAARFSWLASEMAARWAAAEEDTPDWCDLAELVELLAQLAGPDEARFRELMASSWRYATGESEVDWPEVARGARLARGLKRLEAVIADNIARCPARCFELLERLGPLHRFDSVRAPLEAWRERETAVLSPEWQPILALDAGAGAWAARLAAAQSELGESQAPPPGALKIAAWPEKIASEIAALQTRAALPPHAAQRLENLQKRLENSEELRAAMGLELGETLQNATLEAELRAAERAVESCYRQRLSDLGAPKNIALDADWLNAALFSTDISSNRKWNREIVRAGRQNRSRDWRLEIEGNARWLAAQSERGLKLDQWLCESPRTFAIGGARFELRLESDPLRILQMGNYFDTCLSRGGCNAHSSVANAVELNKRVVFARDAKGRVVGRQLLALSLEGKLLGFRVYTSCAEANAAALRASFGQYARDFAQRCGLEPGDEGEVERLFVSAWYDDGTIHWSDLEPTASEAVITSCAPEARAQCADD